MFTTFHFSHVLWTRVDNFQFLKALVPCRSVVCVGKVIPIFIFHMLSVSVRDWSFFLSQFISVHSSQLLFETWYIWDCIIHVHLYISQQTKKISFKFLWQTSYFSRYIFYFLNLLSEYWLSQCSRYHIIRFNWEII